MRVIEFVTFLRIHECNVDVMAHSRITPHLTILHIRSVSPHSQLMRRKTQLRAVDGDGRHDSEWVPVNSKGL